MPEPSYMYNCKITRVVDGDTFDTLIALGFNISHTGRVRMLGIDTPVSRPRNLKEKELGLASKQFLKDKIAEAPITSGKRRRDIMIKTTKEGRGKFGRILATLYVGGVDINQLMIDAGHARPYFGGKKNLLGPWVKEISGEWQRWTRNGYIPMDIDA